MQALADSHMYCHKQTRAEFFRNAYFWKFDKDITDTALMEDIEAFQYRGALRPYAVDYLIAVYGVR